MTDINFDKFQKDVREILDSGVNNTERFMELMRERGWPSKVIVPAAVHLILRGAIEPNGNKDPYKAN